MRAFERAFLAGGGADAERGEIAVVDAYAQAARDGADAADLAALRAGAVDAICLSSVEEVGAVLRPWLDVARDAPADRSPLVVCAGRETARAAREVGVAADEVLEVGGAAGATPATLVDTMSSHYGRLGGKFLLA